MKRIYWMDNLRTITIMLVVMYHVGGVYESTGMWGYFWIVDDSATISWVGILGIIFDTFLMPTMFFIAGFLSPSSLSRKTVPAYIKGKVMRLLLPWLIAVLTLIPIYSVVFLYSRGLPQGNWVDYLHFNNPVSQNWLWFLPVLFAFSLLYLLLEKSGMKFEKTSIPLMVIFSLVISIVFSYMIGNIAGFRSWTNTPILDFENERLMAHFLFFIAGVIVNRKNLFNGRPEGKKLYLAVNAIAWLPVLVHVFCRIWPYMMENFSVTPLYRIIWFASFHISSLVMVYLMVASFRRYLNKTGKLWNALNRNSFGVYIIHVIVLGLFGTLLLSANLPGVAKWIILVISTYSISNLLVAIFVHVRTVAYGVKTGSSHEVSL